jgi:hypothetical protein
MSATGSCRLKTGRHRAWEHPSHSCWLRSPASSLPTRCRSRRLAGRARGFGPNRSTGAQERRGVALIRFSLSYAHTFGPPNDEGFAEHPQAARGLRPTEPVESRWIRQPERMNSIHRHHRPARFWAGQHLARIREGESVRFAQDDAFLRPTSSANSRHFQ